MAKTKKKNDTAKKNTDVAREKRENSEATETADRQNGSTGARQGNGNKAISSVEKKAAKQPVKKTRVSDFKTGIITKSRQFLREVKVELKKVTWPTRKETMASTLVVVILVLILSFYLGVVDAGITSLITILIR